MSGRIQPAYRANISASVVTVHMGNFTLVTEINKSQPFKFHPGKWAGVFIWENVQLSNNRGQKFKVRMIS